MLPQELIANSNDIMSQLEAKIAKPMGVLSEAGKWVWHCFDRSGRNQWFALNYLSRCTHPSPAQYDGFSSASVA